MDIFLEIILVVAVLLVMLVGLIGEILPAIPGMFLIWVAALVYAIIDKFEHLGVSTLILLILIWLIALGIDWIVTWLTAKKVGVSWWGLGFSLLGTVLGVIIFSFWGMIAGMVAGAVIGEYIHKREVVKSFQAGGAVVFGWVFGGVVKLLMAVSMIIIFLIAVVW